MTYIIKSGIDRKVMKERELRKQQRKEIDKLSGLTKNEGACRGDYKLCRENDKLLRDYRRFKSKGDRNKIENHLEQTRREYGQT